MISRKICIFDMNFNLVRIFIFIDVEYLTTVAHQTPAIEAQTPASTPVPYCPLQGHAAAALSPSRRVQKVWTNSVQFPLF